MSEKQVKLAELKEQVKALNKAKVLKKNIPLKGKKVEELFELFCQGVEEADDAKKLNKVPRAVVAYYEATNEVEDDGAAGGADLDGMSRAELKKFIKDNGLEVKVFKSMSDDDLREKIREAMPEEEEEEEPDEEEEEPEEEDEEEPEEEEEEPEEEEEEEEEEDDGLDEMSRAELKRAIKDNDLGVKVFKSMSDDDIRAAMREAMGGAEEEEEEEEPDIEEVRNQVDAIIDTYDVNQLSDLLASMQPAEKAGGKKAGGKKSSGKKADGKKKGGKKKGGPSNKLVIYQEWKKSKKKLTAAQAVKKINGAVKESTVKNWMRRWAKGEGLPAGA